MVFRELTIDDLKDKLNMRGSLFDVLAAAAERAKEICENEKKTAQTQPITRSKRKIERPSVATKIPQESDHGGSSSCTGSKRRKVSNPPNNNGGEHAPLPEEFKNAIEEMARGKSIPTPAAKLVIQKRLFSTDLSSGHNRLSIPINQIADDFLTEGEKQHLHGHDRNKKKKFLHVKVVEPSLASETVKFCRWDMPKKDGKMSSSYVINGKWNAIVAKNKLSVGMVVQLWCFRVDQELCFALVRLPSAAA